MADGLEPPCFQFMADALLEQLRYEAQCERTVGPFFNGLPEVACSAGIRHAHKIVQRRIVLMAEAERLLRLMVPFEMRIRALAKIEPGARKVGPPDFVVPAR